MIRNVNSCKKRQLKSINFSKCVLGRFTAIVETINKQLPAVDKVAGSYLDDDVCSDIRY